MQILGQSDHRMLIVAKDEALVASITRFAKELNLKGGMISGIGAVKDVELGYYELEKKEYIRKTFSGEDYELISLSGNISLRDGETYVHVHTTIGDSHFQVFGGHLFEAVVAVTAEIFITPLGQMPVRVLDSCLGLSTIQKVQS